LDNIRKQKWAYKVSLLLGGMVPIELLLEEVSRLFDARKQSGKITLRTNEEERNRTLDLWLRLWETSPHAAWTCCLIPVVRKWYRGKHGEANCHKTQFLSNHGCYREYLFRIGKEGSETCPTCPGEIEDARHAVFEYSGYYDTK